MTRHAPVLLLSLLFACGAMPQPDAGTPNGTDAGVDAGPPVGQLTTEELDALATWAPHRVAVSAFPGGPTFDADGLSILLAETPVEIELVTSLSRAQDHNSSRSNKTASVWVGGDDFGPDAGTGGLRFSWDGAPACSSLPCVSEGRPTGKRSSLMVSLGNAFADGSFAMRWAETSPMGGDFTGTVTLSTRFRGHVTVLKASDTGDGGILFTSALESNEYFITAGDTQLFEGKPGTGTSPLAVIEGNGGSKWPTGMALKQTANGPRLSFTW